MAVSEKVLEVAKSYSELSSTERREFVDLIGAESAADLSPEWRDEIVRCSEEIDSGKVHLLDGEEVMCQLHAI